MIPNIGGNNNSSAVTVGNELTSEIFRWDQRLYSFVLNFQAGYLSSNSSSANTETVSDATHSSSFTIASGMKEMSESTGGELFMIENMRGLLFTIDSLVFSKLSRIGYISRFQSPNYSPLNSSDPSNFNFLSFVYISQNIIPPVTGNSSGTSGNIGSSYWPIPVS